jgi:thioredoxin-related protein
MKLKFLLPLVFLSSFCLMAQDSASVIMKKAYAQARKENKNVFVIFHASWCGWCKKMDQYMNDKSCKNLFDRGYIIQHLTVMESEDNKLLENPGAFELMKEYHGENSGIPFFLIFDKNGKLLEDSFNGEGQNIGCPSSKEEVGEFIKMLKATSTLTEKELDIIYKIFYKKS